MTTILLPDIFVGNISTFASPPPGVFTPLPLAETLFPGSDIAARLPPAIALGENPPHDVGDIVGMAILLFTFLVFAYEIFRQRGPPRTPPKE